MGKWKPDLSKAMKRGDFKLTHQGIAIGEGGILLDGQHRLKAFIESGLPRLNMSVSFGVPRDAFDSIDVCLLYTSDAADEL